MLENSNHKRFDTSGITGDRLLSLDVMRGLIMLLLAAESSMLYERLHHLAEGSMASNITRQFFHHPWHGLLAWDLVQPAFMTMAGTGMYISFTHKQEKGIKWSSNLPHVLKRCLKLLIAGVALHCVYAGKLVWELWNVLTQLSVTTAIAYLIIRRSFLFQLAFSLALLLIADLAYRLILVPGFDQPFVEHHNFGAFMDTVFMGKINPDGWVTINFISTAAHTIWGCLVGMLLMSSIPAKRKIGYLLMGAAIGLTLGYGIDLLGGTPIIKRIATSTFVLASGGWVLLVTAILFWLIDIKKQDRYAWIPAVVGMNPIFIYLLFETVGHQWVNKTIAIFVNGFTGLLSVPPDYQQLLASLVTLFFYWWICYWLYKKRVFFKL